MKKYVVKMAALFITTFLTFASQTNNIWAGESYKVNNTVEKNYEVTCENDETITKLDFKTEKQISNNKIKDNLTEKVKTQNSEVTVDEDSTSKIYYGTMTGKLSKTNDYLMYPAKLSAGEYLQAKLILPTDSQIDYDLLLFDSSLSLIKSSDYVTCTTSEMPTLDESIGYIANTDETVYVCVYSVGGGSNTESYTLDYTITTNFSDPSEPNENAKEAIDLSMDEMGANVSAKLNSPLDNDWYRFTVKDGDSFDKVRLNISSSSTTNGCKFEIYKNLVSNYYAMLRIGYGTGGEVALDAGTYYIRVVSTNTVDNFNAGDIPTYKLSVSQTTKVDKVTITSYSAYHGTENVDYPQGKFYRVDQSLTNVVTVKGRAYYTDENGRSQPAANATIIGEVKDQQWENLNRPDMSTVTSTAITDSNGYYEMTFYLKTAVGGLSHFVTVSTHHYDLMNVNIKASSNDKATAKSNFYYLKYCD